jgi:hypothetical protein
MGEGIELTQVPDRVQKFLVDYAVNFYNVVAAPRSTFAPNSPAILAADSGSVLKALGFAGLSIALSGILWQALVSHGDGAGKAALLLFVLLSWVIFSCFYYIVAKILGGAANFFASLQSGLLVKSVLHLFATFVSVGVVSGFSSNETYYAVLYFIIYEISVVVYISIAFSTLNAFSWPRSVCFSFLIFLITLIPACLFIGGLLFANALSGLQLPGGGRGS